MIIAAMTVYYRGVSREEVRSSGVPCYLEVQVAGYLGLRNRSGRGWACGGVEVC